MRPTVWAQGADITLSASGKTDEKTLMQRFRAAVSDTNAAQFDINADGTFAAKGADAHAK